MVSVVNMSSFVNKLFWGISEVSLFLPGERRQGNTVQMDAEPTRIQRRDLPSERRDLLLFWELGEGTFWFGWVAAKRETGFVGKRNRSRFAGRKRMRHESLEKRGTTRIGKRLVDKGI